MGVVYKHIRKDTNEVFYIGIGKSVSRANSFRNRNKYWYNIVNSVGHIVEIVKDGLDWKDACSLEKQLIKEYGRWDLGLGPLVNMTDGGEGIENPSFEIVEKIKQKRKLQIFSNESKQKMSISAKRTMTDEHKKLLSEIKKGKKLSDTHKHNIGYPQRDKNVYTFIDKNNNVIECTRDMMYNLYNISPANLSKLINGKLKSIYGWKLLNKKI